MLYGAGVGLDDGGGSTPSGNVAIRGEYTSGIGLGAYGGGVTAPSSNPFQGTSGYTQLSGGVSIGPRFGAAAGYTQSVTGSYRSGSICP